MSLRDQTSARYFNQTGIQLVLDANLGGDQSDLLGSVEVLARLTGAPDDSEIHVSRGTLAADSLILRVINKSVFQYPSVYALFNEGSPACLKLLIDSMYVRKQLQGAGIGARSVMLSIAEAKTLEVQSVVLEAAGSATRRQMFFGYHVWPGMGFDAALPNETKRRLPQPLAHAARLSDLMFSDEGRLWWYDNGHTLELEFDLADKSVSWQLLHRYAKSKGIRI